MILHFRHSFGSLPSCLALFNSLLLLEVRILVALVEFIDALRDLPCLFCALEDTDLIDDMDLLERWEVCDIVSDLSDLRES